MDYSTLSDDELDLLIAKRLGYRVEFTEGAYIRGNLVSPDGKRVSTTLLKPPEVLTEEDVWAEAFEQDYECGCRRVPEWSFDLNAAAQLLKEMDDRNTASLTYEEGGWAFEIDIAGGRSVYLYSIELAPARVICLTWLQWDDIRNRS